MKKYVSGIIAIILAVSATAFTMPQKTSALDPVYDWMIYNASGNPTGNFLEDQTEAQVRAANPGCNGSTKTCFQNYSQDHSTALGLFIKKP